MKYFEVTNEITGELCVVPARNETKAKANARNEFITAGIPESHVDTARMTVVEITEADYDQWYGN